VRIMAVSCLVYENVALGLTEEVFGFSIVVLT
jgi:hypothetical protein